MPSSYLKAMQLTKQLEEKAKEATKNRQLAEEELTAAKEAMDAAKSSEVNTSKAEELYGQANAAFDDKDYKNALSLATRAKEEADKAFDDSVKEIIASTKSLLGLVNEIGKPAESETSILEDAKKAQENKEFDKAVSLSKKCWEDLEKIIHEHMSTAFSSAQSMIVLARNSGDDVSDAETLLESAREAMNTHDYSIAFQHLNDCRKSVDSGISIQIEEMTDEAKGYQITAKELNADVSRVEELLTKIGEEVDRGELEKALSSARRVKSEAEKTLNKAISDAIDAQETNLVKVNEIDADTDKASEILNRSRNALKNGNYGEAHAAINECIEETNNAQFQKVLKTISQSRSKFMIAKKFGADLDEAIEYLNKARESLKDGDFSTSLEMAQKGDVVVDAIVEEFGDLDENINSIEENLNAAIELGVDVAEAEKLLAEAKDEIEAKNPEKAKQIAEKCKAKLESALYAYTTDNIETAELVISAGDNIGANLEEPNQLMHDAIQQIKDGDFKRSLENANKAIEKAEEIIKIHVQNTIVSAELALQEAEGVDETEINNLIDLARNAFDMNAFDESFMHAEKALSMMETVQSSKAKEALAKMSETVMQAKDIGCDTESLESDVTGCDEAIKKRDFALALELAEKTHKEALNLQFTAAEKEFGESKISVIEAKKLGIDINEMRDMLKTAKVAFDKKKYHITFKKSEEAKFRAEKIIDTHQKAYESMTQAAAMVAEAKKNKADVTELMNTLMSAKSAFEAADYEKAKELADSVKEETDKVVRLYTAANKLSTTNDYIGILELIEADLTGINPLVDELKEALKVKDHEKSEALAKQVENDSVNLLGASVTNLISTAESAIMDATDIGIDVSSPREKVEKARAKLRESQYKDAIEFVKSARDEVENIRELSQKAAGNLKELQDALTEAENFHADISEAKSIQNDAMTALRKNEYQNAIELATKASDLVTKTVEEHVLNTINSFNDAIQKAKKDGATVQAAEKILVEAKTAFESKNYKGAIELAMRSEGELEKVSLQQEMAAKAINTTYAKLKESEGQGILSRKAQSLLSTAKQDLKNGNYVKALEHAIQSGDELHKIKEEFSAAKQSLGQLNSQIETSVAIGVEISLGKKLYADAESAMKGNDYNTAQEIAKEGMIEARRLSYTHLNSKISDVYKQIDLTNSLNLDTSGLGSVLAEGKTFLDTGKFKVSNDKIEFCSTDLNSKLQAHILDYITNSETAILHAKEVGADVANSEKLLKEARATLEKGYFEEAINLAKKGMSGVAVLKKGIEKEFLELTYKANQIISTANKFGINVKEAEGIFSKARELKSSDYKAAVELVNNSIHLAQEKLDDFRPRLEANIVAGRVLAGQWVDTELVIKNTGKTLGMDIKVKLMGDIEYQGKTTLEKLIGGGDEARIPIKVKFEQLGDRPIILELISHRPIDNREFIDKSTMNIYVAEEKAKAPAKETFEQVKAPEDVKCAICMGKAKKGTDIIKCSCGKTYHETCATRYGKCVNCANPFAEKLGKDAERDLLKDLDDKTPPATTKTTEEPEEAKIDEKPSEDKPKKKKKKRLSFKI